MASRSCWGIWRGPSTAFALAAHNLLLRALSETVFIVPGERQSAVPGLDFDYGPALRELAKLNVRYLVVHKNQMTGADGERMSALLRRLAVPQVFDDAEILVYLTQAPA